MFKEQDGKGKTPYDLGVEAGKMGRGEYCPYEEDSDEYTEFFDGFYDAGRDDDDDEEWET